VQAAPDGAGPRMDAVHHAVDAALEIGSPPGPVFVRGGPDSLRYGEAGGYPVPERRKAIAQGNPWAPEDRVGAFSRLDEIYQTRRIARSERASTFKRSTVAGRPSTHSVAAFIAAAIHRPRSNVADSLELSAGYRQAAVQQRLPSVIAAP